jgi:hypothetical protein
MIIPDTVPITILRGRDFDITFTFEDLNLTGYTAKSQARETESQTSALIFPAGTTQFTCVVTPGTDSTVKLSLTDTQTAGIVKPQGWYDLLLIDPSGHDDTYVRGPVTVGGSVTVKS